MIKFLKLAGAVVEQDYEQVLQILSNAEINETNSSLCTATMWHTFKHQSSKILQLLIDHGANIHHVYEWQIDLLDMATIFEHAIACSSTLVDDCIIECFLKNGANVNRLVRLVDKMDLEVTALHLACRLNRITHAQLLVQYGADVDFDNDDMSLLHISTLQRQPHNVALLLAACAKTDTLVRATNENLRITRENDNNLFE